jgi:hypothetical protein
VRRSTGADPDATRFYRVEETPVLLANIPRTILEMLWSRLGKSPDLLLRRVVSCPFSRRPY